MRPYLVGIMLAGSTCWASLSCVLLHEQDYRDAENEVHPYVASVLTVFNQTGRQKTEFIRLARDLIKQQDTNCSNCSAIHHYGVDGGPLISYLSNCWKISTVNVRVDSAKGANAEIILVDWPVCMWVSDHDQFTNQTMQRYEPFDAFYVWDPAVLMSVSERLYTRSADQKTNAEPKRTVKWQ